MPNLNSTIPIFINKVKTLKFELDLTLRNSKGLDNHRMSCLGVWQGFVGGGAGGGGGGKGLWGGGGGFGRLIRHPVYFYLIWPRVFHYI